MDIIKVDNNQNSSSTTAVQTAQNHSNTMKSLWNIDPAVSHAAIQTANTFRTTHGMFAGVPIICKAQDCPYIETCMIEQQYRIVGNRCLQEAGAIIARFDTYCAHFGIDLSTPTLKPVDVIDVTLIRDLVDLEIQMLRAENRIAISSDFIGQTISTVDSKGKAYYEDTVTPEAQFKLTLLDKRYKILNQLNSTRKDKAAMLKNGETPTTKAVSIFKKINAMMSTELTGVIEAEYNDVEEADLQEPVVAEETTDNPVVE